MPVLPKSLDFFEQDEIIMVFLHFARSAIPVGKYKKIYQEPDVKNK